MGLFQNERPKGARQFGRMLFSSNTTPDYRHRYLVIGTNGLGFRREKLGGAMGANDSTMRISSAAIAAGEYRRQTCGRADCR